MAFSTLYYRNIGKSCILKRLPLVMSLQRSQPVATTLVQSQAENHFEKNERLKRPVSPHLTIYKFQITTMMSITHRITGLALTGGLYSLSLGMLVLPASFPYYMDYLQSLHIAAPALFTLKFALAWTLFYHTANGIRHLAWDLGYGFELKQLYMSGYFVLGSSIALSLLAAAV